MLREEAVSKLDRNLVLTSVRPRRAAQFIHWIRPGISESLSKNNEN